MDQKWRSKGKTAAADEGEAAPSLIFLSSGDNEEANEDLTVANIEKARQRQAKRKRSENALAPGPSAAAPAPVIVLSSDSTSSGEAELASDPAPASSGGVLTLLACGERKKKPRKKRKKKKKRQQLEEKEALQVGAIVDEEKPLKMAGSVITEVNGTSENLVFRKLLRGPRYFDPWESNWGTCFNCGEEGHTVANCLMEKRQKPCFVCGLFGHNAKQCLQGQDCFVCKRKGHLAKNCPDKNEMITEDSEICLRCGATGHVMSSCRKYYSPDDLKVIQCYICKKYGHLCCFNFTDTGPKEFFCYNCAQPGHTGLGCAKRRGDSIAVASPAACYICHEQGHFARGCKMKTKGCAKRRGDSIAVASPAACYICHEQGHFARGCKMKTKSARKIGEPSTPQTFDKKNRKFRRAKSVPRDFDKERKKKSLVYEERRNMTTGKPRIKGGWIVDDPGDLPRKKFRANNYASPVTSVKNSERNYSSGFIGHSSSYHTRKKWKSYTGTPSSHAPARTFHREFLS